MRTTIDLPDQLFERAKLVAVQRRQTLKQLFTEVLDSALASCVPDSRRMTEPPVSLDLQKPVDALSNREAAALMDEESGSKFTVK